MTTAKITPVTIFADAHSMDAAALERLAAGDIRDAAEKAWCATLRATEALILARTGQQPGDSTTASRTLRSISETDPTVRGLRVRYFDRQAALHAECFCHGYCDPIDTEILIRETADYIQDAQHLAGGLSRNQGDVA